MAEKTLRDGVKVEPTSAALWAALGSVLQALGEPDTAAQCHMTAAELEATTPVIPFAAIPKIIGTAV